MPDEFDPYLNWLGIEPHERPLDHYRLLGLARFEHRREVIQAAADQRMAYIRSFQAGPRVSHTQKLLNELATAKLCLLDAGAKGAYDAALQRRLFPPAAPAAPPVYAAEAPTAPLAEPPLPAADTGPPFSPSTVVSDSVSSSMPTPTAQSAQDQAPSADDFPFYTRTWFPLAAVAGLLVVVGLIWGLGKILNRPHETTDVTTPHDGPEEAPDEPSIDPDPESAAARLIEQDAGGEIFFSAESARLHGDLQLDSLGGVRAVTNWKSDEDSLSWDFLVKNPGVFRVELTYAVAPDSAGGRYELSLDDDPRRGDIRSAGKPEEFVTDHLFLAITRGGRHVLSLRAAELRGKELFVFQSLKLTPRTRGGK